MLALLAGGRRAKADVFDEARDVFREAEALYRDGKYAEAADKYLRVYRMTRTPLVLFNVAQAKRLQFKVGGGSYKLLVESREHYARFFADAKPEGEDKQRAEAGVVELEAAALQEAKKQFALAENAMKLARYGDAVSGYEAVYALTGRTAVLFNLSQANRKQYLADNQLERLNAAEGQLIAYRSSGAAEVDEEVVARLLAEIKATKEEHHRKREASARAKEPQPMREAREHYQKGDAPAALAALDAAEKSPNNERIVIVEILRLRALTEVLNKDLDGAVEAFMRYLSMEPADDGTGLPEAVLPAFELAKKQSKGRKPLSVEHVAVAMVAPKKKVTLEARAASDPFKMIAKIELRWRITGTKEPSTWQLLPIAADGLAKLPGQPLGPNGRDSRVEYLIVARDAAGGTLLSLGTEASPLSFLVSRRAIVQPPPPHKRWWFWAGAGTIIAGVVTTIALTADDGLPNGIDQIGDVSKGVK